MKQGKKRTMKRGKKRAKEPAKEPATEPAMKRGKKRANEPATETEMERGKKRRKKRTKEPATEPEMEQAMEEVIERTMEPMMQQVIERTMEPMLERVMSRVMEPVMEPMMERVIKKHMRKIKKTLADRNVNPRTSLDDQTTRSERKFQLRFVNKLGNEIYTKAQITDENHRPVEIQLINTDSLVVKASIEVEILVLDGDLGFEVHEDWSEKQFNAKIVLRREGKDHGSLVKGKQNIRLTDGVGTMEDLIFTDISGWIKCKKFRLGARVSKSTSNMGHVRIKEAVSEAFAVRDGRSKKNKKGDLPSLDDQIWHLKKITRDRKLHTRLSDKNIQTIRDFKNMYKTNPIELRKILIDCSDPDWEVMVHHADGIVDDDNSNPLRRQEAEACNTVTTGPPLHQGSSGMQNDSNRASSSQYPPENSQDLTPQQPPVDIASLGVGWGSTQINNEPRTQLFAEQYPSPHSGATSLNAANTDLSADDVDLVDSFWNHEEYITIKKI